MIGAGTDRYFWMHVLLRFDETVVLLHVTICVKTIFIFKKLLNKGMSNIKFQHITCHRQAANATIINFEKVKICVNDTGIEHIQLHPFKIHNLFIYFKRKRCRCEVLYVRTTQILFFQTLISHFAGEKKKESKERLNHKILVQIINSQKMKSRSLKPIV